MALLPENPEGWELEDFVAAHFVACGCFVETGVKERDPDEILELDVVWTDYRSPSPTPNPVEVKSGDWGLKDLFKFFGWTKYVDLPPGQFVYNQNPRRDTELTTKISNKMGIRLLQANTPDALVDSLASIGLPNPSADYLPSLWRFSYWVRRRLFEALQEGLRQQICPISAERAKKYRRLINDAIFFEADPRDRFSQLIKAHFEHPRLAAGAALEIDGKEPNFDDPTDTPAFKQALYEGRHLPVQACMYLSHRARLYVLKSAVDIELGRKHGSLPLKKEKQFGREIDVGDAELTEGFNDAIKYYGSFEWFPMLPVFWQVFLWGWGGFLLEDRIDQEFEALSAQTSVPVSDIPKALMAFDKFFGDNWFSSPSTDSRKVLKLMPAALRGIGAFHRRILYDCDEYATLGYKDHTTHRLITDHNTTSRLLNAPKDELVK